MSVIERARIWANEISLLLVGEHGIVNKHFSFTLERSGTISVHLIGCDSETTIADVVPAFEEGFGVLGMMLSHGEFPQVKEIHLTSWIVTQAMGILKRNGFEILNENDPRSISRIKRYKFSIDFEDDDIKQKIPEGVEPSCASISRQKLVEIYNLGSGQISRRRGNLNCNMD